MMKTFCSFSPQVHDLVNHNHIEKMQFSNAEISRSKINDKVKEHTSGHIESLLPPGSLHKHTKLVLADAAYFKGEFHFKFDKKHTVEQPFYSRRQGETVQMMCLRGKFHVGAS